MANERVKNWINKVIEPLLVDILPMEEELLFRSSFTWRFMSKKCEYILPIPRHLEKTDPYLVLEYEDFCENNIKIKHVLLRHDGFIDDLNASLSKRFDYMIASYDFVSKVKKCLEEWEKEHSYPGGAYPRENFHMLIAENIINGSVIRSLPNYRTDAMFWAKYGDMFMRYFSHTEIADNVEVFCASDYAFPLRKLIEKLIKDLRELRINLSKI